MLISLLRIDKPLCLPKLKSITVLLYVISTINEISYTFTFVVEVKSSQALATVIINIFYVVCI